MRVAGLLDAKGFAAHLLLPKRLLADVVRLGLVTFVVNAFALVAVAEVGRGCARLVENIEGPSSVSFGFFVRLWFRFVDPGVQIQTKRATIVNQNFLNETVFQICGLPFR